MRPYLKAIAVAALLLLSGCEALRGLQDDDARNFWHNTTRQVGGGPH